MRHPISIAGVNGASNPTSCSPTNPMKGAIWGISTAQRPYGFSCISFWIECASWSLSWIDRVEGKCSITSGLAFSFAKRGRSSALHFRRRRRDVWRLGTGMGRMLTVKRFFVADFSRKVETRLPINAGGEDAYFMARNLYSLLLFLHV